MNYHPFDVTNDHIDWHWATSDRSSSTLIRVGNPIKDTSVHEDYLLLPHYLEGQYLTFRKPTGPLIIAELTLTFAEFRQCRYTYFYSTPMPTTYFTLDETPPLTDCSEVYRAGVTWPGYYQLDTTGKYLNNDLPEVPCEDGWTSVLIRNPTSNSYRTKVINKTPQYTFGSMEEIPLFTSQAFRRSWSHLEAGFEIGKEWFIGLKRLSE